MRLAQGFTNAINGLCDGRWPALLIPAAKGQGSEGCTGDIIVAGRQWGRLARPEHEPNSNGAIKHSRRNAPPAGRSRLRNAPCDSAARRPGNARERHDLSGPDPIDMSERGRDGDFRLNWRSR